MNEIFYGNFQKIKEKIHRNFSICISLRNLPILFADNASNQTKNPNSRGSTLTHRNIHNEKSIKSFVTLNRKHFFDPKRFHFVHLTKKKKNPHFDAKLMSVSFSVRRKNSLSLICLSEQIKNEEFSIFE